MDKREPPLVFHRETLRIEGGRDLYNYTFREAKPQDRLIEIIESEELGAVGPFLDMHPTGLDLRAALELATKLGNEEAVKELAARL